MKRSTLIISLVATSLTLLIALWALSPVRTQDSARDSTSAHLNSPNPGISAGRDSVGFTGANHRTENPDARARSDSNAMEPELSYDSETIAKVDTLILDFIQKTKDVATLTEELNHLGLEVQSDVAGNSEVGQSLELKASGPERGLHSLQLSFDMAENKSLDLNRIQLAVYPRSSAYADLLSRLESALGPGHTGENATSRYRSWSLGDKHLWIDQYDANDPFDPSFKEMIVVTYETDVEGAEHQE